MIKALLVIAILVWGLVQTQPPEPEPVPVFLPTIVHRTPPIPPRKPLGYLRQQNCVALAIYMEARGEPQLGQIAVAHTIKTRMESGRYPSTACGVVFQREQYAPAREPAVAIKEPDAWHRAVEIAARVLHGREPNPCPGAIHFVTESELAAHHFKWLEDKQLICQIDNHVFYN